MLDDQGHEFMLVLGKTYLAAAPRRGIGAAEAQRISFRTDGGVGNMHIFCESHTRSPRDLHTHCRAPPERDLFVLRVSA